MKLPLSLSLICLSLTACGTTATSQRYAVSADNLQAIKSLKAANVGVRSFSPPEGFSGMCRAIGPMKVADNLTHTQYIQKAFEDELKMAGAFAPSVTRTTLGGRINRLEFSSIGLTGRGYWKIDLTLDSSNGRKLDLIEHYEFDAGYIALEACRNTAEAYPRAVQNLLGKAVHSQGFAELLRPQ